MKVLVTGASGQLGNELCETSPADIEAIGLPHSQLDISDQGQVQEAVRSLQPSLIINAAAYTAVDKAEADQEKAYAINASGAANLARAAQASGARLIHLSTDFVFDGKSSTPYLPTDRPNPLGVYGASKLAGEMEVNAILGDAGLIVRTAWVYAAHGNNFVKTMLRLMGERAELGVVADQIGSPTWAKGLAMALWQFSTADTKGGVYHWTDAGVASWYDFAVAIQEEAISLGLLQKECRIMPINTAGYPTPAKRPAYSVLDKTSTWETLEVTPRHWRVALREMLAELRTMPHA